MKLFFLLGIAFSLIFATTINGSLLKIHATIVPKLFLMDYSYKEKVNNNSIIIALIYNRVDYKKALLLKNRIEDRYSRGLKSFHIKTKLVLYSDIDGFDANIYYLFPSESEDIRKVLKKADENQALTFSYLENDLKYGVMISLNIGKKVRPILNLDAIRQYKISFRPILLDICNIYVNNKEDIL